MKRLLLASALLLGCGGSRPASGPGSAHYESSRDANGPFFFSKRSFYTDAGSKVMMEPSSKTGYTVSRRCAQGPLELEVPALGAEHGEFIWIELIGPRHVAGQWKSKPPGSPYTYSGTFKSGDKPENERCVAPDQGPVAAPPGGGGGGVPGGGGTPGSGGGTISGGGEVVVFTPTTLPEMPEGRAATSIVMRLDEKISAGASIKITLWSETPQDWEGILVWVEQGKLAPDDLGKWQAAKEEKKKASAQASADASAKAGRRSACINAHVSTKKLSDECRAEFPGLIEEHEGQMACWTAWNKAKVWTDACVTLTGGMDPRKTESKPSGPPPAAPPDPKPPQPSVHAEWVPGSFYASGTVWVWSPGLWKVPKEDVDSGQTAKAPSAPPAPKAETPPPKPSPDAVWTPGWWAFSFQGWVWVGGAWRNPPFAGATWRAYAWVAFGASFTLVPGGWIKP